MRIPTCLLALLTIAIAAHAGTGALDPSFGIGGRVFIDGGFPSDSVSGAQGVFVQPDGKVIVAGNAFLNGNTKFAVIRYQADGSIDSTFGSGGRTYIAPNGPSSISDFSLHATALQPDGRILLAGSVSYHYADSPGYSTYGQVLVRLNAGGALDPTFGGGGSVWLGNDDSTTPTVQALAVQSDGKIVIAGSAYQSGTATTPGNYGFAARRLNPDGSPDSGFNGTGVGVWFLGAGTSNAWAIAIQADGRIVLGGTYHDFTNSIDSFGILRLNADGTVDASFNGNGVVITPIGTVTSSIASLAIQADGKIVAAGGSDGGTALARYLPGGSLDTTFNASGTLTISGSTSVTALVVQADGKIVSAGFSRGFAPPTFHDSWVVVRRNPDGQLDSTFGSGGVRVESACDPCAIAAVALNPDGKLVAAGSVGSRHDILVTRLSATGATDTTFGTLGVVTATVANQDDTVIAVALQPDGKIVAVGQTGPYGGTSLIARLATDGSLDAGFPGGGILIPTAASSCIDCNESISAVAVDAGGKIITAGALDSRFTPPSRSMAIHRYNGDGSVDATFGSNGGAGAFLGSDTWASALALQPDGKIVVVGGAGFCFLCSDGWPVTFGLVRFTAAGASDISVGGTNDPTIQPMPRESANAVAFQPDGGILSVGVSRTGLGGSAVPADLGLVRYTSAGAIDQKATLDIDNGSDDNAGAVVVQADGKIVVAGRSGANGFLVRFSSAWNLDASFANAGKRIIAGDPIVALALQPDGKIVALTRGFNVLRFLTDGSPDLSFGAAGRFIVSMGPGAAAQAMVLQPDGKILVAGTANGGLGTDMAFARVDPAVAPALSVSPLSYAFGAQTLTLTSPEKLTVSVQNVSAASVVVSSVSTTTGYGVASNDCTTLAPGASCSATVTFTPTAWGSQDGTLTIVSDKGIFITLLTGTGERTLSTHYYRSILRREPDSPGKAFWDGEASRIESMGADINEAWFAMAMYFYSSPEYLSFNRSDADFVTDLYDTFFNRVPDAPGLAFWVQQIASGLPREVVLASFMFSPEFVAFTRNIFGAPNVRAEINLVMDFYRGFLARLPEYSAFNAWVGRLRAAQCKDAATVQAETEAISAEFIASVEYLLRGRTDSQFVGDLYNALLRRGGDLEGVKFWISAVGTTTRGSVRQQLRASPEFAARVSSVIAQGCAQ